MSQLDPPCPVSSYNEWDPLEEVIVGDVSGAYLTRLDHIANAVLEPGHESAAHQEEPYPPDIVDAASEEVDLFINVLLEANVEVRRPSPTTFFDRPYSTPFWSWPCGKHAANPRDVLLVVGEEIIEAPTPRRSRHYEVFAYRELMKEYSRKGARWVSAPWPMLTDELFRSEDVRVRNGASTSASPITEFEPVFDAADFVRCGRDIFYQRSFVTNDFGIQWLRRHLGSEYRFHEVRTNCKTPIHIDTTFVPLCPGKALINPEFVKALPPILESWDVRPAPEPVRRSEQNSPFQTDSGWLSMNVLSLSPEQVVVEAEQADLIRLLDRWGFEPIAIPFQSYYSFGGGFHCCTLDVRRRGVLESYFPRTGPNIVAGVPAEARTWG